MLRLIARKYGHDMHSENTMHEKLAFTMNWHQNKYGKRKCPAAEPGIHYITSVLDQKRDSLLD